MITADRFADICRALPYRNKGMFYSEVFLFLDACANHGIDLIIESGVKHGMSTALIAAAWPGELISIDKDSGALAPVRGVTFLHGDSRVVIPAVLAESQGRRVAILIDGPKGAEALALKNHIWPAREVRLVAIHDVPSRADSTRHSRDPEFRRHVGLFLDSLIKHQYSVKYPDGPGLAIWEK